MASDRHRLLQQSGDSGSSCLPCSFYVGRMAVVRDLPKKTERPAIHTPENQFKSAVDAAKLERSKSSCQSLVRGPPVAFTLVGGMTHHLGGQSHDRSIFQRIAFQ
jgi:hypothetical protein